MVFKLKIGYVTSADHPNQEDPNKTTSRPVIILEDHNTHVLVAPVTKQLRQAGNYKYYKIVRKTDPEYAKLGLSFESLIAIDRIAYFSKYIVSNTPFGECSEAFYNELMDLYEDYKSSAHYTPPPGM